MLSRKSDISCSIKASCQSLGMVITQFCRSLNMHVRIYYIYIQLQNTPIIGMLCLANKERPQETFPQLA